MILLNDVNYIHFSRPPQFIPFVSMAAIGHNTMPEISCKTKSRIYDHVRDPLSRKLNNFYCTV